MKTLIVLILCACVLWTHAIHRLDKIKNRASVKAKCDPNPCGDERKQVNLDDFCKGGPWSVACCKCIATHESHGNANACNLNKNGSKDIGVMQINSMNWASCNNGEAPCDPEANKRCAKKIYNFKHSFKLWYTLKYCTEECGSGTTSTASNTASSSSSTSSNNDDAPSSSSSDGPMSVDPLMTAATQTPAPEPNFTPADQPQQSTEAPTSTPPPSGGEDA